MDTYPYSSENDAGNDITTYFFNTQTCIYSIVFNPYQYQERINDYPTLLENGVGFSIYSFKIDESNRYNPSDPLVSLTICHILLNYISLQTYDCILLYHCDHSDGRQAARSKIFEKWETRHNTNNAIVRYEQPIEYQNVIYYYGYISSSTNLILNDINEEFHKFSNDLIKEEKNKP